MRKPSRRERWRTEWTSQELLSGTWRFWAPGHAYSVVVAQERLTTAQARAVLHALGEAYVLGQQAKATEIRHAIAWRPR